MKLLIAPLLLSPVFASKAGKLAKFPKAKAAKSYSYGSRSMSISVSMSFGPPPVTLTECGEIFTDTKVVLAGDLDCGGPRPPGQDQELCAVTLDGPQAEIDCQGNTLSQATSPDKNYPDGPFGSGICLNNGAMARNCNVERFYAGIYVNNGGEVRSSFLTSNYYGMYAYIAEDSSLTIEDTDASNNVYGLRIDVFDSANAQLIVKGDNTFNSNDTGMYSFLYSNSKLDIIVESDATLNLYQNSFGFGAVVQPGAELNVDVKGNGSFESCGDIGDDIYGNVFGTATFSGDGYTCDQKKVRLVGPGTVVEPICQPCA